MTGISFGAMAFGQSWQAPYPGDQAYAPQQQPYPQQAYPPPYPQQNAQPALSPDALDNLVAPIALYPDPLLSEVLAASTYPLEIVEAQQWLQQRGNLQGAQLIDAARQTGWDPSVQALVAFPDVLNMLNRDVQWTTDLGNAFLAQQSDVMDAIQRMRAAAEQNGRLQSTPQQVVTNGAQGYQQYPQGDQQYPQGDQSYGQGPIQIQPADPDAIYVPAYNPQYVWGPPAVGYYPALPYPPVGYGIAFGVATLVGSLFTGFLSFGGWGWGLSWLTHSLLLNGLFFSHFGFGGGGVRYAGGFGQPSGYARSYGGSGVWTHDPAHRLGVPYSSQSVASRFGGSYGNRAAGFNGYRGGAAQSAGNWRSFGADNSRSYSAGSSAYRGEASPAYRGYSGSGYGGSMGFREPARGYSQMAQNYNRSFAAPSRSFNYDQRSFGGGGQHFSAPKSSGHFSTPHFSAPHFSGGGHSSGHSSGGGHSGGHSGGHHR